jgi:hypothetical protein
MPAVGSYPSEIAVDLISLSSTIPFRSITFLPESKKENNRRPFRADHERKFEAVSKQEVGERSSSSIPSRQPGTITKSLDFSSPRLGPFGPTRHAKAPIFGARKAVEFAGLVRVAPDRDYVAKSPQAMAWLGRDPTVAQTHTLFTPRPRPLRNRG